MQVTTVGLDLAKTIFHVHGVTEDGEIAFNRPLRRSQVLSFFDRLAPCLIGVEACASTGLCACYSCGGGCWSTGSGFARFRCRGSGCHCLSSANHT